MNTTYHLLLILDDLGAESHNLGRVADLQPVPLYLQKAHLIDVCGSQQSTNCRHQVDAL
jgi:hypothetical protein